LKPVDGSDKTAIQLEIQTRPVSKAIDQIGIIKDINSLVLLSGAHVLIRSTNLAVFIGR
jgi:hypothetical protein